MFYFILFIFLVSVLNFLFCTWFNSIRLLNFDIFWSKLQLSCFIISTWPFRDWCQLKGHTYLKKIALFKHVWLFSGHKALKGYVSVHEMTLALKSRFGSSHLQMFFIKVIKNFANFTGKHLFWNLFSTKLQASGLFLWNLRNLQEHLFYRTPPLAASIG